MKKLFYLLSILLVVILASCGDEAQKEEVKLTDPQIDAEVCLELGHYWNMSSVAFSPDGKYIISSAYDRSLRKWDTETGNQVKVLQAASPDEKIGNFISLDFSPDGKKIAAGTDDYKIWIINAETLKKEKVIEAGDYSVKSLAFSPDGAKLASGSYEKVVKIWDAASGELAQSFDGHTQTITALEFTPDGSKLASASEDSTVRIWDLAEEGKMHKTLEIANQVDDIEFSADGAILACNSNYQKQLQIWDIAKGKQIATIEEWFTSIEKGADSTQILTANNSEIKAWNIKTGEEIKKIAEIGGRKLSVCTKNNLLAVLNNDAVNLIDMQSGAKKMHFGKDVRYPQKIHFSPTGRFIVTENSHTSSVGGPDLLSYPIDTTMKFTAYHTSGSGNNILDFEPGKDVLFTEHSYGDLAFHDLKSGNSIRGFEDKFTTPVIITPDGASIIAKDKENNELYAIYDAQTGEKKQDLITTDEYYKWGAVSEDGKYYVLKTLKFLKVFELPSGKEVKSYEGYDKFGEILFLTTTSDGKYVVGDKSSGKFTLKDIMTGAETLRVSGEGLDNIYSAAICPAKKTLVFGTEDWSILLFNVETKQVTKTMKGHKALVSDVAFSPNGKYVVSASQDKQMKIWDVANGAELLTILGLEKIGEYDGETKDYVVVAPNGRIDGTEAGIKKVVYMKKGEEIVPVDKYWDKIYTPNLLGKTLGQDFVSNEEEEKESK